MKRLVRYGLLLVVLVLTGCQSTVPPGDGGAADTTGTLRVVTTLFPYYDFVRQIAGDYVDIELVLPAGMDSHSFEPTPAHMKTIGEADILIRNGGEMEHWMSEVLDAIDTSGMEVVTMMDDMDVLEAEEEHEHEGHDHDHEDGFDLYDEHIWTSPRNAKQLVLRLCEVLKREDPAHAGEYQERTDVYVKQLEQLDGEFRRVMDGRVRDVIVVADKFPFRYLAEAYDLDYRAAFLGCSSDTEPSAKTIASLVDQIREENIPAVYYLELSSRRVADLIAEETGAVPLLLHSCHNVTRAQFDAGITYLALMESNVENLRKGLDE